MPPPSDEGREEIQKEEEEEKGGETDLFSIQITDPGSFSSSILSSPLLSSLGNAAAAVGEWKEGVPIRPKEPGETGRRGDCVYGYYWVRGGGGRGEEGEVSRSGFQQ